LGITLAVPQNSTLPLILIAQLCVEHILLSPMFSKKKKNQCGGEQSIFLLGCWKFIALHLKVMPFANLPPLLLLVLSVPFQCGYQTASSSCEKNALELYAICDCEPFRKTEMNK